MGPEELARLAPAMFEQITDFIAIVDADGIVTYVNPHGQALLGYPSGSAIGLSIVDVIHPDELARAAVVMTRIAAGELDVPVTPASYRLRAYDGSWRRIEINATAVGTGADQQLVVVGRNSDDLDLQNEIMDLLSSMAPSCEAIALVPEYGNWRHHDMDYAVFYLDDDGDPRSTGSPDLCALGGIEADDSPWAQVAERGEELLAPLATLAPSYQARAGAFVEVWGMPVADPLHGSHAVVAFARRVDGAATEIHQYALDTMAKSLRLILIWRRQVVSLQRMARHDPLTGLANRTGFWEGLSSEPVEANVTAILYIDLDGFKAINDRYGHSVGDAVLAEVGRRLATVVRPGDVVARIGGDEFAIVARGLVAVADAIVIAERVIHLVAEPFSAGGVPIELGVSIGIAAQPSGSFKPDEMLEQADRALYRAKAAGRGRWQVDGIPPP